MTIKKNKNLVHFNKSIFLYLIILFIIIYLILYCIFIRPQYKIHELQSKEWITDLTNNMLLGVNDNKIFNKINRKCDFISFWYCYWFFQTKNYTAWILFNLKNKFSDELLLSAYIYDFNTDTKIVDKISLKFSNLKITKENDILFINCGNNYKQEIDFKNNRSTIYIHTHQINMRFEVDIDDYTTNQSSFLPRYQFLNKIINVEGASTSTPGDWMSDNPYIGKIRNGNINNDIIENGGNFWFDNFIGCNNNFLSPYMWFVVLNDDWMIYLLWFDVYEKRNDMGTTKPILIKNRKTNTFIYSGTSGIESRKTPFPINQINNMLVPFKMTYNSNKPLGVNKYDDYNVSFESSLININITSIKNKSTQVFKYNYYKTADVDMMEPDMNKWDQQYYKIISNIIYIEYINMVNVEIEYNGKKEHFVDRLIIDAMYPNDKTIPLEIS